MAEGAGEETLAIDAAHMVAIVSSPEDALAWTERALALANASADPVARGWRGPLQNNVGWTFHESGRFDEALARFDASRAAFEEAEKPARARIARWAMARTLRSLERYEEALAAQTALEVELRELGEPDGYVFEEMGENLLALERGDEARAWFAKAHATLSGDAWLQRNEPDRLGRLERLAELGGVTGAESDEQP